jgi:hypothetical protein
VPEGAGNEALDSHGSIDSIVVNKTELGNIHYRRKLHPFHTLTTPPLFAPRPDACRRGMRRKSRRGLADAVESLTPVAVLGCAGARPLQRYNGNDQTLGAKTTLIAGPVQGEAVRGSGSPKFHTEAQWGNRQLRRQAFPPSRKKNLQGNVSTGSRSSYFVDTKVAPKLLPINLTEAQESPTTFIFLLNLVTSPLCKAS